MAKTLAILARQRPQAAALPCDTGNDAPKVARVLGPYQNRNKWRLVVIDEKGNRSARVADSQAEAERLKAGMLSLFEGRSSCTIGKALDEWLESKRQAGHKPRSVWTIGRRIGAFLPLNAQLREITPPRAVQIYLEETKRVGRFGLVHACTHHKTLIIAKGFFRWVVEQGYLTENPFSNVKQIGKASAGKPQLRQDEAAKFYELASARARTGDRAALALLVQLVMGLRSSEVLGLRVRDLDAGGTVLVIEGTKTKNAKRRLSIESATVRELLMEQCTGRSADDLIFGRHNTNYLNCALRRLCHLANIPRVCPHSLRGLHSSLAVTNGESSRAVAQALGHGNDAITRKHYITPEALETGRSRRVIGALERQHRPEIQGLAGALATLKPEQLAKIMASVEEMIGNG